MYLWLEGACIVSAALRGRVEYRYAQHSPLPALPRHINRSPECCKICTDALRNQNRQAQVKGKGAIPGWGRS